MTRWLILASCAACGRFGFEARSSESDATGGDCWAAWKSGAPHFSAPSPIAELALAGKQGNPWLTADGNTLYFDSGTGDTEIFRTTRAGRGMPFGAPQQLAELSSAAEDTGLVIVDDGHLAVLSSTRSGSQGFDLYFTERSDSGSPFRTPEQSKLANTISSANELDPFLTGDGLTLVYSQSNPIQQVLLITTRSALADSFRLPTRLMGTGTRQFEADPDLSPDQLVLAFAATDADDVDLYAAVRTSSDAAFDPPFALAELSTTAHDGDPAFSPDGCELFWISDRGGDRDLFHANVLP